MNQSSSPPTVTDSTPDSATDANPNFGQGGSYSYDPATGQTTLIERSGHTPAAEPVSQPVTQE